MSFEVVTFSFCSGGFGLLGRNNGNNEKKISIEQIKPHQTKPNQIAHSCFILLMEF